MTWKEILKTNCMEKAGCGCAKCSMEKLSGNQDKIDANKDGEITAEDFKLLRDKKE